MTELFSGGSCAGIKGRRVGTRLAIISLPRTDPCIFTRRPDTCETAYTSPTTIVRGSGGSLQAGEGRTSVDQEYLDVLERELDRAEVVEPEAIPRDVVTMNSEVRLKDLDSGESRVYRLIFPTQTERRTASLCSLPSVLPCSDTT